MSEDEKKRPRLGLAGQVMLGLMLGIAVGVFFGERVSILSFVGDVFIRLLQMTVLPYVAVSLITGLGGLDYRSAGRIARRGGLALLVLAGIPLLFVVALPATFPGIVSASFFSSSLVEEPQPYDLLSLYIPSNPFYSMVHNLVPAVVLFSIVVGSALIAVRDKQRLLEPLNVLQEALMAVTGWIARLAPYGVFALTAVAAGTLPVHELERLQVYLLGYITAALLLTLWFLPGLVAVFTPLRVRDVLGATRGALITAFAIGNLLVVLPILVRQAQELVRGPARGDENDVASVDVLVPTSFSFPSSGKILALLFLPFGAWFAGRSLGPEDYVVILTAGPTSFFAQTVVAVPFLLDMLQLPADLFQLFIAVDVFTGRFGVMVAAMFTVSVALLGTFAGRRPLRSSITPLLRYLVVSLTLILVVVLGLRLFFAFAVDIDYQGYKQFIALDRLRPSVSHRVLTDPSGLSGGGGARGSRLHTISERGSLRACYFPDSLPFAFVNEPGRLVGYDVEMAHDLARALGTSIDFARVERANVVAALEAGTCDIVMSGFAVTTNRAREVLFSDSYMETSLAFVMRDHERLRFRTWERLRSEPGLRIGVPSVPYYQALAADLLPEAQIVGVDSLRAFFSGSLDVDALLFAAEPGSAWTLVYPEYTVVVPRPGAVKIPLAYALPSGERELAAFVDTWLELKRADGSQDRLFAHWILGEGVAPSEPRWSVIRNVLHWVD